jgi:hypothetical protein
MKTFTPTADFVPANVNPLIIKSIEQYREIEVTIQF